MSLDLKVNLDPSAVQQALIQSIIDSSVGKTLIQATEKWINHKGGGYYSSSLESVVDEALRNWVKDAVARVVINDYGDLIRERIKAKITDEAVSNATTKLIEKILHS